jgi:hypothetical protein
MSASSRFRIAVSKSYYDQLTKKYSRICCDVAQQPAFRNFALFATDPNTSLDQALAQFRADFTQAHDSDYKISCRKLMELLTMRESTRPHVSTDAPQFDGPQLLSEIEVVDILLLQRENKNMIRKVLALRTESFFNRGALVENPPIDVQPEELQINGANPCDQQPRDWFSTRVDWFLALPDPGDVLVQRFGWDHFPSPEEVSDYLLPRGCFNYPTSEGSLVRHYVKVAFNYVGSVGTVVIQHVWRPVTAVFNCNSTLKGLGVLFYRFCRLVGCRDTSLVEEIYKDAEKYFRERPVEFLAELVLNVGMAAAVKYSSLAGGRLATASKVCQTLRVARKVSRVNAVPEIRLSEGIMHSMPDAAGEAVPEADAGDTPESDDGSEVGLIDDGNVTLSFVSDSTSRGHGDGITPLQAIGVKVMDPATPDSEIFGLAKNAIVHLYSYDPEFCGVVRTMIAEQSSLAVVRDLMRRYFGTL